MAFTKLTTRTALASAFLLTGVAIIACGDDDDGSGTTSGNATTSGGTSGSTGSAGNSSGFGSSSGQNGEGGASNGSTGASNGSTGASGTSGAACATSTKKAEKVPLDMVIGLDTSFSMDFDDKWINVREALKSFVGNPNYTDLGVGLQFFPLRKQCSVADYESLAVPLALQPTARGPINDQLSIQKMAGGTPIVPVLQGLNKYLATNKKDGRKPVIVLATDGFPDETCLSADDGQTPNTLENAVKIAETAFKANPPISTFVIGVGGELDALDLIAAAGGTGRATVVSISNARAAFLAALENIRKAAIPCDYDIPQGGIDVAQTNVTYTTKAGTRQLVYTKDEAGCAKAANGEGWYFDSEVSPKKVILCKAACDQAKLDDSASVDLVFGCPRNDVK